MILCHLKIATDCQSVEVSSYRVTSRFKRLLESVLQIEANLNQRVDFIIRFMSLVTIEAVRGCW